jgi:TctA family transporter
MMLSFIGMDPATGIARYSGDLLFLWDGLSLVTAVLALFAVPEMIALGVQGGAIAKLSDENIKISYSQVFSGVRQLFTEHWWLALRTSAMGAIIGMIPGLGSSAASWLCYGHAVQSSKHPERFGKGAIEGVIAPETASNAREGGALLPTIFFGIPASSGMAVLLGAFLILGIQPGPNLLKDHRDLVWMLIWALVVGNIMAVSFLLFVARWVGKLTFVNGGLLVPFILCLVVVGSYVNEGQWENLVILFALSLIGYGLLKYDWPRAPFVIGLVLGKIAEESLNKALALWGGAFFLRPLSLILMTMIVATIGYAVYKGRASRRSRADAGAVHAG